MTAASLIARHADAWYPATHHRFLDAVREGTLAPQVFAAWLTQDYLFVSAELAFQARTVSKAPRLAQATLVGGLVALEAELTWFENHAARRGLALKAAYHPTTRAYRVFLQGLDARPFTVGITALWAIERAYLEAWQTAAPGHSQYREFVEHWTTPEFAAYVDTLERLVDSPDEAVFLEVARLERAFWDMAMPSDL